MTVRIGQRVRTTVDAPAGWPGAFTAPAGTLGTIASLPAVLGSYGIALDGDPDAMPAAYEVDEFASAE
ncbi:hypothetical protein [Streptomyces decoyicus]|uniref:hypothetical protein n=1 Tax=Streptomyces decoyicus TaxID=249567 RepID=UPI0033ABD9A8